MTNELCLDTQHNWLLNLFCKQLVNSILCSFSSLVSPVYTGSVLNSMYQLSDLPTHRIIITHNHQQHMSLSASYELRVWFHNKKQTDKYSTCCPSSTNVRMSSHSLRFCLSSFMSSDTLLSSWNLLANFDFFERRWPSSPSSASSAAAPSTFSASVSTTIQIQYYYFMNWCTRPPYYKHLMMQAICSWSCYQCISNTVTQFTPVTDNIHSNILYFSNRSPKLV